MTNTHPHFIISVMSRDRVGIIADVAGAITEMAGDIADLRQSVLRGYFTMILLATFPRDTTEDEIRGRLTAINAQSKTALEIAIKRVKDDITIEQMAPSKQTYVLTATGQDRIGFVADLAAFCATHTINILDLSTTVDGNEYIMILLVDLAQSEGIHVVQENLAHFSAEKELSITLQHNDIFTATNEITMQ